MSVRNANHGHSPRVGFVRDSSGKYSWRLAVFMGPAAFLVILMFCVPIVLNLIVSLTDMGPSLVVKQFTLRNYERMLFLDTRLSMALIVSFIFVPTTIVFNITLALVLAIATTSINATVGVLYRIIWLLPRVSPVVVFAMLWKLSLSPSENTLVNTSLIKLGFNPLNLLDTNALAVVICASVMVGTSLGMIIFTSAIKSIPSNLFHAAAADGAGRLGQIRHVILPALKWHISFISAFQTLSFFAGFEIILLITDGGPFYDTTVYPLYAASRAFNTGQYAYGAALSTGLVVIGLVLAFLIFKLQRGNDPVKDPKIEVG